MVSSIAQLPNEPLILKQHLVKQQVLLQEKEAALKNKDTTLRLLEERLRGLLHKRFGVSSEQASDQFNLFDEA